MLDMDTSLKKTVCLGLVASVLVGSLVLACGGSTPPPTPPKSDGTPPPAADASTPSTASTSSTPPADTAAATADAGPPTPKPVAVSEPKDECTPVGVDFEKRARPKLKECYAQGKKKDPNLEGTVKVKMTIDVKGKIKSVKVIEKTLPDPIADCMLKVVKATPFPEVEKCWDATITIPITFPTPH
jgi:TonB family protein